MGGKNKYGKPIGDLIEFKSNFFQNNESMLKKADAMAETLKSQTERTNCKICEYELGASFFESHGIGYILCKNCGHLNSNHEDTDEFAHRVYIRDNYAHNYSAEDQEAYDRRLQSIYVPKAEFLLESLYQDEVVKEDVRILDIGAGSGYFVKAVIDLGVLAEGIEISEEQVEHANNMIGEKIITAVDSPIVKEYVEDTKCNVLSAVGVLEHIINLQEVLAAIKENENIKYVYVSVPMFSFSSIFEASHQHCYNRHMGGTHTHLFSQDSLQYMADRMGFTVAYDWIFGSDMMDLYRFICVTLEQNHNTEFKNYFADKFLPLIDDLQFVVDKSDFASEVHMVLKRK